jgi:hypothetical protein
MPVFCGIDWAEDHHDVALVDEAGALLTSQRSTDDMDGYQQLLGLLAQQGDDADHPIPIAIETPRGLLVACLRAAGRPIYPINPLAVARYRERYSVARVKSDKADAVLLANVLRTDRAAHRCLPVDSERAQAIAVLARAHQDAVWGRQQLANQLRSLLREYYPAFLEAFQHVRPGGLTCSDARGPGCCSDPNPRRQADPRPSAGRARPGWSPAQCRGPGQAPPPDLPPRVAAPAALDRGGPGPPGPGPAYTTGGSLPGC